MNITGYNSPPQATWYASPVAGELTKVLKSARGRLHYLRVVNTTAAKIYVHVYDNTAASGTLLTAPIPVAANDQFTLQTFQIPFTNGCTVSASTSATSYVAAGANSLQIHALSS